MKKRTLFAAIFALFFASGAQAQIIGDVNVDAPGLRANVSATTSTNDKGSIIDAAIDADANADADISAAANIGAATGSDRDDSESLVITRSDLNENDGAVYDPADITTSAELSAYARSIMSADENIVKIEFDNEEVSIWYKEPAEFLGFIPVTVTTKATVTTEGEIDIDRPWYDVFVSTEEDDALENTLGSTAGTIARAEISTSTELSSNAQARLLNALRAGMKMHYESTSTATASSSIDGASE